MKLPIHFIVVDDDPINNMLCQFGIRRVDKEADIQVFTSPEEALDLILKNYAYPAGSIFTILFLDINMPTMTGWEFLETFKHYDPYIRNQFRIFIVSSSVDERDKERAGNNELVSEILCKPLKADEIRRLLVEHGGDIAV